MAISSTKPTVAISQASTDNNVVVASGTVTAVTSVTNVVHVDDNAGSLTVDGSVTATQGTAANLNATVVGTGTFAVQAALTAGTATNEVVGDVAHDAPIAGNPVTIGAVASAAAPTDVSADQDAVRLWALRSGALAAQPTFAGVLGVAGNGASGTGVQRVTLANDSTGIVSLTTGTASIGKLAANSGVDIGDVDITSQIPGTGATNLGKAEDAAHTSADTGVMMLGVRETTLTDLSAGNTDGDYEPFQVNKAGAVWVTGAPSGTSGWLIATGTIGATKTDIGTANTAGNVGGWYIYNANASVAYVQFFNAQASAVTLGTTAPVYSLGIPATSAANVAPGMIGLTHATAICIAITTTRAGSTGPASTVDYNLWYKQ